MVLCLLLLFSSLPLLPICILKSIFLGTHIPYTHPGKCWFPKEKAIFLGTTYKAFSQSDLSLLSPLSLSPQNLPLAILHYLLGLEHANSFGSSLPSSVLFSLSECFPALIHEHQLSLCYRLKCVMWERVPLGCKRWKYGPSFDGLISSAFALSLSGFQMPVYMLLCQQSLHESWIVSFLLILHSQWSVFWHNLLCSQSIVLDCDCLCLICIISTGISVFVCLFVLIYWLGIEMFPYLFSFSFPSSTPASVEHGFYVIGIVSPSLYMKAKFSQVIIYFLLTICMSASINYLLGLERL